MIGVELIKDAKTKEPNPDAVNAMVKECLQNGLVIENAGLYGNVIRFLCPLVVTNEQLEAGFMIFESAMETIVKEGM